MTYRGTCGSTVQQSRDFAGLKDSIEVSFSLIGTSIMIFYATPPSSLPPPKVSGGSKRVSSGLGRVTCFRYTTEGKTRLVTILPFRKLQFCRSLMGLIYYAFPICAIIHLMMRLLVIHHETVI